ncbi:MAG: ASCH domain-containing protein [Gemmatimonadales bacterium]|nr:ASCH domain-containing protein [Gemmatimonadales bacterium]
MRALTVRQPWAWAIVSAGKDIENRSWATRYRGWLAIHAAAGPVRALDELPRGVKRPPASALVRGAIVGVAYIDGITEKSRSKWFQGEWGWVLKNTHRLKEPVPCKGALSLWRVPAPVRRKVLGQLPKRVAAALGPR